ncbi:MAG: chromosome segregation protein ScpA [Chitinivibrionales bacterium]|nr:chromosome segregation protein ScpA [Chitinivibrionales bacterium]
MKTEYAVKLELFEGPLDLLLFLVNKAEVAITKINVSDITGQYLEYLDLMRDLNIDVAGEYLHMAAVLIRLKARELLPSTTQEADEATDDDIYTREQLIAKLLEYKKFKEAAESLKVYESEQFGSFGRGQNYQPDPDYSQDNETLVGNVSIFDLITAFKRVLERHNEEDVAEVYQHVVESENARIDDRIEYILGALVDKKEVRFEELFQDRMHRLVLVVTFMALLELVKMQEISFRQEERFGAIFVTKTAPPVQGGGLALHDPDDD